MAEPIAMILAGGQGSRLSILSNQRAKPAVPFGGNYRIIDFVLSNVMHSNIRYMGVLTQYKPYSLMAHIGNGEAWGFVGRHSIAKVLPPYIGDSDNDWYAGTADAIYQNLSYLSRFNADAVVVLSGDHIYSMSYADMLDFHFRNNADLTIATQPVPWEEASRFGVLKTDKKGRVEAFQEKPKQPLSNQANLGIYVFKRSVLEKRLREDAANPDSSHDFGKDVIPRMIEEGAPCYGFEFNEYWRDVGTLQSFWEANMDCLDPSSGLNLAKWAVHTNCLSDSMEFCMPTLIHSGGSVIHSTIGKDSEINGTVINSILFRGVKVAKGAVIRNSIIMDDAVIGPGARIDGLIADKHLKISANAVIGEGAPDAPVNRLYSDYLNTGLVLFGKNVEIPEGCSVGRNCLVYGGMKPGNFPSDGLGHGVTLSSKGVDVD